MLRQTEYCSDIHHLTVNYSCFLRGQKVNSALAYIEIIPAEYYRNKLKDNHVINSKSKQCQNIP